VLGAACWQRCTTREGGGWRTRPRRRVGSGVLGAAPACWQQRVGSAALRVRAAAGAPGLGGGILEQRVGKGGGVVGGGAEGAQVAAAAVLAEEFRVGGGVLGRAELRRRQGGGRARQAVKVEVSEGGRRWARVGEGK